MTDHPVQIRALTTANPTWYVTQAEAFTHYQTLFRLEDGERDLYRRLLLDGPIRGRHIAMDTPGEATETNADALNQRYLKHGRRLGAEAVRRALAEAGVCPSEVGGLVVNSCTGYLCPGLCSYVLEDVGLPDTTRYADLMGMGCGGALPNLSVAMGMIAGTGGRPVLSVAVEVCTATLFMGTDPGLIVSNAIFGDGASAALLLPGGDPRACTGMPLLLDYESGLFPRHRGDLQ
ncbi:MAG: 3-oxoacyl-ACP synthase, partial [Lentisphaeria bacterium]|nr:3-oxoacyl-ACP synthase [Lentisphaeria bacterium]